MAIGESIAEALLRLGAVGALSPWQEQLSELLVHAQARPAARIVRIDSRGRRTVYEGWRIDAIGRVLDACSDIEGDWWIAKVTQLDSRGRRYEGHTKPNGSHLKWRQNNPEAARENSRKQAAKWRDRARQDWHDYCAAYADKFPGQQPIGFDRWCRQARSAWLAKGPASIVFNDTSRSFEAIVRSEFQARNEGVSGS